MSTRLRPSGRRGTEIPDSCSTGHRSRSRRRTDDCGLLPGPGCVRRRRQPEPPVRCSGQAIGSAVRAVMFGSCHRTMRAKPQPRATNPGAPDGACHGQPALFAPLVAPDRCVPTGSRRCALASEKCAFSEVTDFGSRLHACGAIGLGRLLVTAVAGPSRSLLVRIRGCRADREHQREQFGRGAGVQTGQGADPLQPVVDGVRMHQ